MRREEERVRNLGIEANLLAHDVLELGLAYCAVGVAECPFVRDEGEIGPGKRHAMGEDGLFMISINKNEDDYGGGSARDPR